MTRPITYLNTDLDLESAIDLSELAAALEAAETARKTFEEGSAGEALPTLAVGGGTTLVEALVGLGLVASKNEARRLIAQGGARVDGQPVGEDVPIAVTCDVRISAGKKKHGLLVP